MIDNRDCVSRADLFTFMSQTAAAGFCYNKTVNRTFVTCRIQHVYDSVIFGGFQYQPHPVLNDMAFLIDTTAKCRLRSRNDRFGNIPQRIHVMLQFPLEKAGCDFLIYQILNVLYIAFKIAHFSPNSPFLSLNSFTAITESFPHAHPACENVRYNIQPFHGSS